MKRVLSCAALVLLTAATPAKAATISLVGPALVSNSFDVVVQATNVFARRSLSDVLFSFGFDVNVSAPSVVQFTGATSGPNFDPVDTSLGPDVFAAASGFGISPPIAEPLVLATLHFIRVGSGAFTISVSTDPTDPFFSGLQFLEDPTEDIISGRISGATVPEPTTMLLVGIGLAGAGAARRRTK